MAHPRAPEASPPCPIDPADALAPIATLGPFDLLDEAGHGGQGVVYRARRRGGGDIVAVKRLTAVRRMSDRLRSRFEREWEAARRLDHPGIVRPLEIELVHGEMLIAMEWIEGITITRWADGTPGGERRAPRQCAAALAAVAEAVVHAHQRGVIHRDLKPSNILVDDRGVPRILDFGLAKMLDEDGAGAPSLTGPDEAIGTIPYAAPEQILGGASLADTRADVYALGAVLYRMLTGRPPHSTDGPLADVLRSLQHDPPRPSSIVPGIGRDLDAVVLRALRRQPAERYQSADALLADLRRYLAGEPVGARPPGPLEHLRGLIRRHRVASIAAAAVLAVIVVFGVISGVLAVRLAAERNAAVASGARAQAAAEEAAVALDAVRELLAAARPGAAGGDATVVGTLERAADLAKTRLAAHPAAGAEVAYTVGYTYRSLWKWRESVPHLERALELSRVAHGAQSEAAARCMVALGTSLSNLRDPRAVELQREALRIRRAVAEPDAGLIAESLMRLGYALHRAADPPRPEEAERCLTEALEMRRALRGPAHESVAECLHHLAYMRWRERRTETAFSLYREALDTFRAASAQGTAAYAECLTGFAAILASTGEHAEAIALYRELIPLTAALYGRSSTFSPLVELGGALSGTGDHAAAAETFVEAARVRCAQLLSDHPAEANRLSRLLSTTGTDPGDSPAIAAALRDLPQELRAALAQPFRGLAACWQDTSPREAAALLAELGQ